jgi:MYXO-CTERM domain-containing protein
LAITFLFAGTARGYVRTTTTKSNVPVQWTIDCIVMQPDSRGSQDVSLDQVQTTLQRAINNWTTRTASCPGLAVSMRSPHGPLNVAQDGINAVVFQDKTWSHDAAVIGLTTVVYLDLAGQFGDGTILEADIELNGTNYTFSIDPANGAARDGTMLIDLESTMTHELGHVQGLAHNCWDHVTATAPKDNTGMTIPDCNDPLPPSITGTTMYPYYGMPGDISKRMLAPDDVAGVCDVYKPIAAKLACYPEIDGGCTVAPQPRRSRWPLVAGGLLLAGLWAWRRRR